MNKISMKDYLDMQLRFISARLTEVSLGSASSDNDIARMAKKLADRVLLANNLEVDDESSNVENAKE
jgi:hypothetical protein